LDHQHFLDEILNEPENDDPRLVYADWLSDNGDPRGEFIQIQCRRASLPFWEEEYWTLRQREQELLKQHRTQWAGELPKLVYHYQFHRGFPGRIYIYGSRYLRHIEQISKLTPMEDLAVHFSGGNDADQFFDHADPIKLKTISFGQTYGNVAARALAWTAKASARNFNYRASVTESEIKKIASGSLPDLEGLTLVGNGSPWHHLFASEQLKSLTSLRIEGDHHKQRNNPLFESPLWQQLKSLSICFVGLSSERAKTFFQQAPLKNLDALQIQRLKTANTDLFANGSLKNLKCLSLDGSSIKPTLIKQIEKDNLLPNLRVLCIHNRGVPAAKDCERLLKSKVGQQLYALYDGSGAALNCMKDLKHLKYLQTPSYLFTNKTKIDAEHGTHFSDNRNVDIWFGGIENWNSCFT